MQVTLSELKRLHSSPSQNPFAMRVFLYLSAPPQTASEQAPLVMKWLVNGVLMLRALGLRFFALPRFWPSRRTPGSTGHEGIPAGCPASSAHSKVDSNDLAVSGKSLSRICFGASHITQYHTYLRRTRRGAGFQPP